MTGKAQDVSDLELSIQKPLSVSFWDMTEKISFQNLENSSSA